MNDVALCANDVLCNDVMLRINDVALRANGHAFGVRRSVGERLGAPVFLMSVLVFSGGASPSPTVEDKACESRSEAELP